MSWRTIESYVNCRSIYRCMWKYGCQFGKHNLWVLSEPIEKLIKARSGLKILSNLCTERKAVAYFEIPVISMGWK